MSGEIDLGAIQAAFASHRGGRFRVDRFVGRGGMGTVFLAFDTGFRQVPCAIKVINLDLLDKVQVLARFRREAQIMVRVKHPAVVEVYDLEDLDAGLPYIVLEWVDGGSLSSYIENQGPLSPTIAVNVMTLVCAGVEAAHAQGVIHRDIKPDNILLGRDGYPKVTDFGIAMMETGQTRLTQDGTGMGSLGYMAPEQMQEAKTVDARADVHALGVTLWTAMTGKLPPRGLFFQLSIESEPELLGGIPDPLVAIIRKATQIRPDDRYTCVSELREALLHASEILPALGPTTVMYGGLGDPMALSQSTSSSPLLPIPSNPSLLIGATFDQTGSPVAGGRKPDPQSLAARLASPLPSSSPPPPVDTMHEGSAELGGSRTQFARELARTRHASMARAVVVISLLIGGAGAWWWFGRDSIVPIISSPSLATATTAPAAKKSESVPALTTKPEPMPRREAEAVMVQQKRKGIEVASVAPAMQAVELAGTPTEYPVIKPDTSAPETDKPKKGKSPKPGKHKKPSSDGKMAVAEAPKVPEPVVETQRVGLTFPEGDPVKVWLVGPSGRHSLPGSVPPGTYKVMVRWPNDDQDRTAIGTLHIGAAGVTVSCKTPTLKCRAL